MTDTSLADSTPAQDSPVPGGGAPTASTDVQPPAERKHWTIEEILEEARLPELYASVCLRADLEAEHQRILAELATLVDPRGEVIGDPERPVGEVSAAARAQELADQDQQVVARMRDAMWYPLFRGMSQEDMGDFNKKHLPKPDKDGSQDLREYNAHLVAVTAIEPELTVDQVKALRKKLGPAAYGELTKTAQTVCLRGGVDVPKSPGYSVTPPLR